MNSQPSLQAVHLRGERLVLRELRTEDARVAFPLIHARPRILEWLVWQGPATEAELSSTWSNWRETGRHGENYRFAIVEAESGTFIGSISVRFGDHAFQGDLGYWLAEDAWGRGYGTEAVQLLAHLAFRHLRASVLSAEVFVGNHASCRVLEKAGFRREMTIHTAPEVPETGRGRERWIYLLTRGDFDSSTPPEPREQDVHLDP